LRFTSPRLAGASRKTPAYSTANEDEVLYIPARSRIRLRFFFVAHVRSRLLHARARQAWQDGGRNRKSQLAMQKFA
jgi:hypothetical protein